MTNRDIIIRCYLHELYMVKEVIWMWLYNFNLTSLRNGVFSCHNFDFNINFIISDNYINYNKTQIKTPNLFLD